MSHPRMAFTAELWSDQAVVCRAMEGQVGCSVVQEFGPFPSWTEANHFAGKLNEGLGLSPVDARKIHTEALLAASECLKITSRKISFWDCAPVIARANLLQVRSVIARLKLALTLCHVAHWWGSDLQKDQLVRQASDTLDSALSRLPQLRLRREEAEELFVRLELLRAELSGTLRPTADC